jgi:hypothetical protein
MTFVITVEEFFHSIIEELRKKSSLPSCDENNERKVSLLIFMGNEC